MILYCIFMKFDLGSHIWSQIEKNEFQFQFPIFEMNIAREVRNNMRSCFY